MTKIEITKPRHHWWQRTRTYSREIAGNWTELDDSSRLFCVRELLPPDPKGAFVGAKTRILRGVLKLPKKVFNQLSDENMSALIDCLDWLTLDADITPIVPSFDWKGIRFDLPKAKFENGTALEFALGDQFLDKFTKTGEESDLLNLVSVLARHQGKSIASKEESEYIATNFKGLPIGISMSVLLYFVGIKEYIHKLYGELLFGDNDEDADTAAIAHFPNFGWWGSFLQIAESGVFGNYEQVLQTNFHRVVMFLIEKRKESERMKAMYDKQNTKNV
jgi:hypothetical protein